MARCTHVLNACRAALRTAAHQFGIDVCAVSWSAGVCVRCAMCARTHLHFVGGATVWGDILSQLKTINYLNKRAMLLMADK